MPINNVGRVACVDRFNIVNKLFHIDIFVIVHVLVFPVKSNLLFTTVHLTDFSFLLMGKHF